MKMGQSVPKCRHIKFRRWGITQKKTYNSLAYVSGCIHFLWKWNACSSWRLPWSQRNVDQCTKMGRTACLLGGDVTQHAMYSNNHCQWWQHLYQEVRLNYGGSHSFCLCCLGIGTSFICWRSLYNYNSIRAKQLWGLMDFISFTQGNYVWRIQGCHRWIYTIMEQKKILLWV
jgi:hypothetical protein